MEMNQRGVHNKSNGEPQASFQDSLESRSHGAYFMLVTRLPRRDL